MTNPHFIANPYALFVDGVCTNVVFMQAYTPEEIEETLKGYEFDKAVRLEDYGYDIFTGDIDYGDYIAPKKPYDTWVYNKERRVWIPPVRHPWDVEREENPVLSTRYEWDTELEDWVPSGPYRCCNDEDPVVPYS